MSIRVRRSKALIVEFLEDRCTVNAFLHQKRVYCDVSLLKRLADIEEWTPTSDALNMIGFSSDDLVSLIEGKILVVEGSEEAELEANYADKWQWGTSTAFYHFATKDTPYLSNEDESSWIAKRAKELVSPPLLTAHSEESEVVNLKEFSAHSELRSAMFRRRTERRQDPSFHLRLDELADLMFSGMGITGFYDFPNYGRLPLKMAPSGGGRNPFEAYVLADRVNGLDSAVYHYSAVQHSLLKTSPSCDRTKMFANQEWVGSTAATIVFVANFERDWWKYPFPASYRPVLIELGHIVQNIMLLATEAGLSCVPTGAVNDTYAEDVLGIDKIGQAAFYSVSIGKALPEHRDWFTTSTNCT